MVCVRGVKEYEPARFMTVNQCIEQLLEVENERKEGGQPLRPYHLRPCAARCQATCHDRRSHGAYCWAVLSVSVLGFIARVRCGTMWTGYAEVTYQHHTTPLAVS